MAEAPAQGGSGAGGAAGAKQDPQALIAKHAAVTQAGAQGDAAIVSRVENAIKNSPMGWLQGVLGETGSRASSEQSQVSGKLAEHKDLVANQKDVPKDAGPPPAPGPAAHPAVPHPAAPAHAAVAAPAPAAGGAAEHHAPIAGASVPKSAPAAAPAAAPAPTVASAVAGAGDSQIDGILNGYTPKGAQSTQTVGRIKSMGDIAQGFNGQLDTYIAQGGAVEQGIAGTANFLGVGKDVSAVWANNPYRKVHGILGGIMTGMSAVKNVCGVVGSICGKLGMVLTVIGLLGMIFPPIGAAVSGIARILNVVGLICDSISFVLSGILTGLNGVVLAQQIAAGASAEEKAATADLMMSEANEAASGFVNLAMVFGPKFMKGLLGNSKGIVASLIKRAKATIGRISLKLSANVSHFANKIVRKLGFGGSSFERVGGAWKDTGFLARTKETWAGSKVGKAFSGAPQHLQAVQDKLMAKYGNTAWAKGMDRVGAWGGSVAHKLERFDLGEQAGRLGEKSGSAIGGAFAETKVGKSMAAAAERSELQTRELTMKMEARDAAHLEESRWKNQLDRRQTANPDHVREPGAEQKFVSGQGQKVRDEKMADFQSQERQREAKERLEQLRTERFERRNDEFYENKTNGITGVGKRDEMMAGVHNTRERRYELEAQFKPQETERKELLAKATKSASEQERLTALNGELRQLDEARRVNKMYETDLSGLASGAERVRAPEYNNWKDVGSNAWEATAPALEMVHLKDQDSAWAMAEKADLKKQTKYNKGTAQANAAGRGGHGTFADIAADARHRELDEMTEFVRAAPQTRSVSSSVKGMLSPIINRGAPAAAAPAAATAMAPTQAPAPVGPGPVHAPGGVTVAPTEHKEGDPVGDSMQVAAQVHEPPVTAAAPAHEEKKEAPDEAGGEALPYWPALIPEFDKATHDFGWMRKVAVEFKKAQIDGKQKAVDTLAVYGRYKEYAAARAAAAQKNTASAAQTGQATQQNVSHASQTEGQAGQGEQKQGEAKGAANDRAATELPEPESRGFWGRILGAVKRWAKNKAAQVFGWIQEKIASVILKGLCGVSMGDMREYAGALRRQQQAAHGVADGAGKTSGQAQQTSIKLSSDATKEAQGAADAIGECDKNIVDADQFMADIGSFEQQLTEEKAHAQMFIASVHAAAEAERTKQQQEAAAHAAEEKKEQDRAAMLGGGTAAPAATPTPAPTAEPAAAAPVAGQPASEDNAQDVSQIHAASQYVATEAESMTSKLDARADDYTNQLALALTNRTGKGADGVDLKGPAKKESKHIVEEFKEAAQHTKIDMEAFHNMSIDPSQSKRIAEQIITSAQHLEETYNHSEDALDELFARTYNGIKDGRRTLKSRMLDGDNALGAANHAGDAVDNKTIDTALPTMNTAWDTVAKPIQTPAAAPIQVASNDAAPVQRKATGEAAGGDPNAIATAGVQSANERLPHHDQIQASFGRHDVSGIRAQTGGGAAEASRGLGASAYAVGDRVGFAQSPDLHTAAHEAAHVVQQRGGVQLKGGIDGGKGDPHEAHADAVADKVVRGESAERLLDTVGSRGGGTAAVQRKSDAEHFVPSANDSNDVKGVTAQEWMHKNAAEFGSQMTTWLQGAAFAMPSPFAQWKSGTSQEFAAALWQPLAARPGFVYAAVARLIEPDAIDKLINGGRDVANGEYKLTPDDKEIQTRGTADFRGGVVIEIGKILTKRIAESLDRVMPRWLISRNQLALSSEGAAKSPDRDPHKGEVVPSHPVDEYVISALDGRLHVDLKAYRAAHPEQQVPQDIGKLGALRPVKFQWQHDNGAWNWIRVTSPADATKEDVAMALYGDATYAHTLTDASPLFGFTNTNFAYDVAGDYAVHSQNAKKPPTEGDDDKLDEPEQQLQKGGALADEILVRQAADVKATVQPNEDGRLAIVERMRGGIQLFEQLKVQKLPAGTYANLLIQAEGRLSERSKKLADKTTPIAEVMKWDGQSLAQIDLLMSALNGVSTAGEQFEHFKDWPNSRTVTQYLGWLYLEVACLSEQTQAARDKLAHANQQSQLYPVTLMEALLAEIRKVIRAERGSKLGNDTIETDSKHDEMTDQASHATREAKLQVGLARVRDQMQQNPKLAGAELKKLLDEMIDLQNEVSIVADMDQMDVAWKALHDDLSVVGVITGANSDDSKKMASVNKLGVEWAKIYGQYKSGDKAGAKKALDAKRPEFTKLMDDIKTLIQHNETKNKWVTFGIMVGIALVTAGVGAYVEGAAGAVWGASSIATFAVTTGAEAATFTSMSYLLVEKDPSIGGFFLELGKNALMFGALKGFGSAYAKTLGPEAAATFAGKAEIMAAQFVAMNVAALVEADARKYIKTKQHLTPDEVLDISKQNALMTIAVGFASMSGKAGLEGLKLQGEADISLVRARGLKTEIKSISQEILTTKGQDIARGKDLLAKQRELLVAEEQALQTLEKIAADPKKAAQAGLTGKNSELLTEARHAHDANVSALKAARVMSNTEGNGKIRWVERGEKFEEAVDFYRHQDGSKVVELVTDPVTGAKGIEVRTKEGESFRMLERISAKEDVVAASPQLGEKAPTEEQAAANRARAEAVRVAMEDAIRQWKELIEKLPVAEFKRIQVGGDVAGLFNQASMPKVGGGGAKPATPGKPEFVTISDRPEVWKDRGPVNQTPGELIGPGLDPSKMQTSQHDYVDPKALADAIMVGKFESGMAVYQGHAEGAVETRGGQADWQSAKALRIKVGLRYFYADAIDLCTGPGPSAELPDSVLVGGKKNPSYQAMLDDHRITYGDQAPTQVVPGAKTVVVSGGSGNGAAMAEFFAKQGCDVLWVARESAREIAPNVAPEIAAIDAELAKPDIPEAMKKQLQAQRKDIAAFARARLPRNVEEAFDSKLAKDKIKRQVGAVSDIESFETKDGKRVRLKINGEVKVVDQFVVSQGQNPEASGAAGSLAGEIRFKMILDGEGRVVGLESVHPPGAVRLMGSAFAEPKMQKYVIEEERPVFARKVAEQAQQLPPNSNGVAPSIANAAQNIEAANDVLAAKTFKLDGVGRSLELKPENQANWPIEIATFLGGEMGIDPARIKVDPITDGKSGTPIFHVKVGAAELGYLKIFSDSKEAATEIAMLKKIAAKKGQMPHMEVVGDRGTIDVTGDGTPKTGLLMTTAEGTSVDGMIKNLPIEGTMRTRAIEQLRGACVKVARGLAEMHEAFADGKPQSAAQKEGDGVYILGKLDGIRGRLGDSHYQRIRTMLEGQVIPKYKAADVPATNYHGDANVGNFILKGDKLQLIDVGSMKWSEKNGAPVGTGAADVGRFLESLQTKHPGALSPEEIADLTKAFNKEYFKDLGGKTRPADLEAATLLYRIELELTVINNSSPGAKDLADTTVVGAIGRLDALLGIPPSEYKPIIPPAATMPDDQKKLPPVLNAPNVQDPQ